MSVEADKTARKRKFIEAFVDLTVAHLSTMPPQEQKRRLDAAEAQLSKAVPYNPPSWPIRPQR